ncbi:acyl-CoA-binding protein [Diplonema papillatum]|nr:acyl-CoA-binding protein [Diplonema papillatum]
MDYLRSSWWGGGLLTAASQGDVKQVLRILNKCEDGEAPVFATPGGCMEGKATSARERARRRKVAVNFRNDDGFSALHLAVSGGHGDMLEVLGRAGADVNMKTGYGRTALHLALESCDVSVVDQLLRLGCDAALPNANGRTAQETAENELAANNESIAALEAAYEARAAEHAAQIQMLRKLHELSDTVALTVGQPEPGSPPPGTDLTQHADDPNRESPTQPARPTDDGRGMPVLIDNPQRAVEPSMVSEARRIEIEIEDADAEYAEMVRPVHDKLAFLRRRNRLLSAAHKVFLARSQGAYRFRSSRAADAAADDAEPDTPTGKSLIEGFNASYNQLAQSGDSPEDLSVDQVIDYYVAQVDDDFGVPSTAPEAPLMRHLQTLGIGRDGRVGRDQFCMIMLRLLLR